MTRVGRPPTVLRAATAHDLTVVTAYAAAEELVWFGELEYSPDELTEVLGHFGGIERGTVAVDDANTIRGFAITSPDNDTLLVTDPADPAPPYDVLLAWLVEHGGRHLEVFAGDAHRIAELERRRWTHIRSAFTMARPPTPPLDPPRWPEGVVVSAYDPRAGARDVHHLVYVDAAWASVAGHTERGFDSWYAMTSAPEQHAFVAHRDGRAVGWVIGRVFETGRGWVFQIAVAADERGRGLGRALLLHGYAALLAAGATSFGLEVQAANDGALGLYRSVGLDVTREWRVYAPPLSAGR